MMPSEQPSPVGGAPSGRQAAPRRRLTAVVHRVSPYHLARFEAMQRHMDVALVEANGVDATYDWDAVGGELERTLLFPTADVATKPSAEVRRSVYAALNRARPDVVVIPGWGDALALCSLSWCLEQRVPSVVLSDSTAWDKRRVWWQERVKSRIVRLFDAALVAGTPHVEYVVGLGFPREKVFTGCDVVDNDYFRQRAEAARARDAQLRQQLGLPKRYLLTSSRFIPRKNLERLLSAYALYRATARAPASLVVLGSGPLRQTLQYRVAELGIEDHVSFRGFVQYPELPDYYALAEAFVLSSTADQWGLVVNEAMASGLPVLVSNRCGCAADLVEGGDNGFTFDPEDEADMASALTRILSVGTDLSAMRRASQRIIANWSLETFCSNLTRAVTAAAQVAAESPAPLDRGLLELLIRR